MTYIQRGGLYDFEADEEARQDLETAGVVARCQTWTEVQIAAHEHLKDPPEGMKLHVWKNPRLPNFPWCLKWVKEEMPREAP